MGTRSSLGILIGMAFTGSVGLLLLLLGCALPPFGVWWPMFVICFYVLAPFPLMIARRVTNRDIFSSESNHIAYEVAYFVSAFIVVSGFGFTALLGHKGIIEPFAALCVGIGNLLMFITIYCYFIFFRGGDDDWEFSALY